MNLCAVKGHQYQTTDVINERVKEFTCVRCGHQATSTVYGGIVPMSETFKKVNKAIKEMTQKRALANS